jgi:hypothetical protein
MKFVENVVGTKININIYFSLLLLLLGFVTQVYIKYNFGLEVLGLSVLIRTLNSETFYSFVDLGVGEELLFEKKINKYGFYVRIVSAVIILFLFTINIGFISEGLKNSRNGLFFMMCSSYLLFLNKLYYKKENNIKVVRMLDIINSIFFISVYLYTTNLNSVLTLLGLSNLLLFFVSIKKDILKVFNLTDSSFSIFKSSSYYITSLSAKLEGGLLSLVIPAISSTDILGKFDLITKIPKAFKSQLGEFNSLKKYDFLYHNKRRTEFKNQSYNRTVTIISIIVLITTLFYLYLLELEISLFYFFVIISELLIGLFFNKYNIRFVELFIDTKTRLKYVISSFLRSILFLFMIFIFNRNLDFELIMTLWYLSFFIFFIFIYKCLLNE